MESDVIHGINHIGSSLPVENVQELASKNLKEIPHRYIRSESQTDEVSAEESSQIPIIDMAKLVAGTGSDEHQTQMSRLHQACKEWGFFQITNHGATTAIENMKTAAQEFFALPLGEKMVYAQQPGSLEGYGQAFVVSDDQKLDWCDMLVIYPIPVSSRNMRFWPKYPASFRSSLEDYSQGLHKICINLLELTAMNLGVEFKELASMYVECTQTIRMNYYPPCSQPDMAMGITPHSDATSLLTLLVQVNEVEGLQIRKNGKWVPVKPLPGAIIVNVGDAMEIMSNGEYISIEHRAVVNSQKERISVAAFHSPSIEAKIGPLLDIVKEKGAKYKTVKFGDYMKEFLGNRLDSKTTLDSVKIYD